MTHRLPTPGLKKLAFTLLAVLSLTTIILSSCTKEKKENNDGAKFVGTWNGTSTCGSSASDLVLKAGSNGSTITMDGNVGDAACSKAIVVNMTASGNNLTISPQTFTDLCGLSYTFAGSGTLNGNTLTITFNFTGAITATCTLTVTK